MVSWRVRCGNTLENDLIQISSAVLMCRDGDDPHLTSNGRFGEGRFLG